MKFEWNLNGVTEERADGGDVGIAKVWETLVFTEGIYWGWAYRPKWKKLLWKKKLWSLRGCEA